MKNHLTLVALPLFLFTTQPQAQNLIPGDSQRIINNLSTHIPPPPPTPDRLTQMGNLLKSHDVKDYQKYKELCAQGKGEPRIGMTVYEARATSWCFPLKRHVTTNVRGEFVQEEYLKNPNSLATYPDKKYLYFENDILVSIQE
jgi:hypothetical protein